MRPTTVLAGGVVAMLVLAGCGSLPDPAGKAGGTKVGKAVVGKWWVVEVDGKAVPEGRLGLDYRSDGRLVVDRESDAAEIPRIDPERLRKALEQLDGQGMAFFDLHVRGGGIDVKLKRKPGTITVESR